VGEWTEWSLGQTGQQSGTRGMWVGGSEWAKRRKLVGEEWRHKGTAMVARDGTSVLGRTHRRSTVCWFPHSVPHHPTMPFAPSPNTVRGSVGPCKTCRARGVTCKVLGPGQACITCRKAHQSCSLGKHHE
jgi:hypothetical protein